MTTIVHVDNAFRILFDTKSCDIANECVLMFGYSVYDMARRLKSKCLNKLEYNETTLCKMFRNRPNIQVELTELSVSHLFIVKFIS